MAALCRILIVEDNDALRETLSEVLSEQGFAVAAIASAEELSESQPQRTDIAILDLNLPGEDGLSLAARLRRIQPGIGIIILTVRNAVSDRLAGYDSGADLYLPKPITPEELLAALRALARRLVAARTHPDTPRLDVPAAVLHTTEGPLSLRKAETTLLRALALAPEGLLETWQLLEALGKPLDEYGRRQLAVLVTRLRARLEAHGLPAPFLRAERGVGYRLLFEIQLD
ncbi:response regulator transcription factor [Alkalilimnicola sp. S0819]|uniref:response regulator transcription factor n=1 Tax=Alkalilimnicola sp. S0819 TaxID=2613922 RepID=UPI00126285B1|nr:response regulator transcription factor [Alkalilimnicola sp. S0819]KAB7624167.1 response regulator transcription factor [Alkalilimnicola sp. S0819]MPQ16420.1 response regulator [Alkalilimnicola sp. S0819]